MKSKLKSLIAILITICMVISILPINSFSTDFGNGEYEFSFDCQSYNENFTVGTITVNGNNLTSENDRFFTNDGQYNIYVNVTSTGAEPNLKVNGNNTANISLDQQNGNTYTFKILYDMTTNSSNHLSVSPQANNSGTPNGENNNNNTTGNFTYSFEGDGADVFVNNTMIPEGALNNQSVNYYYDNSGYVTLDVGTIFLNRLTELKVNGVDYSNQLPETNEQMLAAFKDQHFFAHIQVPYSETYTITTKSVKTDDEHMVIGNFLWSRRTPSSEEETDDCLDHGNMELVSLKYNGNIYYPGDEIFVKGSAYDWSDHTITDEDPTGITGGATLPAGAELTVKLVPEYGYQLVSFGPNGGSFTTDSDKQSVFTFEVGKGNFHLAAHFEQVADVVNTKTDKVEAGNIKISDNEIDTGSVVLSVEDVELADNKVEQFANAAGDYEISQYLNIDLNQIIYKGTENDVWSNKIDELNNEATITLQLSDGIDADDIVIVHNIHNGDEYELINLESYYKETNTITFKTKSFSNYAIATKKTSAAKKLSTDNSSTSDNITSSKKLSTGDNLISIIETVSSITIACLGIILTIKKNKNISIF